jgi:eukaryotic-like serine/threonine-protein kinase
MAMEWTGKDPDDVRDLSWYDWSIAKDISPDGQWVLFEESSEPTGPNYAVAIRNINGSPPIRLGEGTVGNLSPDGKWAVSALDTKPPRIQLMPVGAGQARQIALPELEHVDIGGARFMPNGKELVINGNQPGRAGRAFLINISGGKLRPVTPEGERAGIASPDGKYLAGYGTNDRITLFPTDGGAARPVPTPVSGSYIPAQWSADGKALYMYRVASAPLQVYRVELSSGKLTPIRTLTPRDRAGVIMVTPVVTDPQATEFAYSYYQILSVLYVISGLR